MSLSLRPYQREAVDALYRFWEGGGGNGLLVLPTGAGKSLVLATIIKELSEQYPGLRIACVTHSKELIVQNFGEILKIWPSAPVGIYSAGVGRRDARAKVLFCGIQSVFNKVAAIGKIDLLIVDEAHLIPRNSMTMYGKFIERLKDLSSDMRIVGLTATPFRTGEGRLDAGEDALFDGVVYEAKVIDLIDQGYLSPLKSKAGIAKIDVSGVHTRAGDYVQSELEAAAMKGDLVKQAVSEIVALGHDRKAWLAFCSGVEHAEAVAAAMREAGIAAQSIDGTMEKAHRDTLIRDFRQGRIRCLTSVNLLAIGFNVPHVDLVALMRPTKSAGLYVQSVGRAFRIAEGKQDALILDYANVIRRHGPVDAVSLEAPKTKGSSGDGEYTAAKECPNCQALVAPGVRSCPDCGFEWPIEERPKHESTADDSVAVLSNEPVPPKMLPVVDWEFRVWQKLGSPDSVRVSYYAGISTVNEWLAFEYSGRPREHACRWWSLHSGAMPFPKTTAEAMQRTGELSMPATISVKPNGKYLEVVGRGFKAMEAA
jgi:DNA repair protein RadD